ncbi:MAG: AtpZ/AtpI family protein [Clostridia bacterium]|jgi:ATP synthase protein I|nr:AtpZ/AtpI family protein [Clostridia bacterium]
MRYIYFGISFGLTMAAGLYLGYQGGLWLDARFSTEPIFTLLGLLLGVVVAFRGLIDKINIFEKADKNKEEE